MESKMTKQELELEMALAQLGLLAANLKNKNLETIINLVETQLNNILYAIDQHQVVSYEQLVRSIRNVAESMKTE